jgi:hypothetical protein
MAFVVGCGRSGTTILGQVLSTHPQIAYFFEPWHLWRAVDSRTDVMHLFGATDAHILMGAEMWTPVAQRRFNRLFLESAPFHKKWCIEKISYNAMRIGFLEALSPGAKYIHIVRDGLDVVSSIAWLADTNRYKLAFRKNFNQWWGENDSKWDALKREGEAAGYFAAELPLLGGQAERAAYEWLVSLAEIDRRREALGDRLHELRFPDLVESPKKTLRRICEFLDIDSQESWMNDAVATINADRHRARVTLTLPSTVCAAFNEYQSRFGFTGRAMSR